MLMGLFVPIYKFDKSKNSRNLSEITHFKVRSIVTFPNN
jgi:hypothetical protein